MTTKLKQAFQKAAELPDTEQDAFANFLLEELEFIRGIEQAVDAADNGRVIPLDEARQMIPKWISESSSQKRR